MGIFFFIFIYLRFYQKIHISSSLIAGFTLSYMFLDIIPNIITEYPDLPSVFASPPIFLILIVFSGQHIPENLILQSVAQHSQIQTKEVIKKEINLQNTEQN